jgi:hypothetical protein
MAVEQAGIDIGWVTAAADLSAKQFYIVKLTADESVNVGSSAGEAVFGVLQNDPASGAAAIVRVGGVSKVLCGTGGLSAQDLVQTDAAGKGITATSGDYSVGVCVKGAAAGEYATIAVGLSAGQVN